MKFFGTKSIRVNFGKYSKSKSQELISDKIKISLIMSQKFLEEIPMEMNPTNEKYNRLEFEMMSEGFLFFLIGARDALLQKINHTLGLGLDADKITLDILLGNLDKQDKTQKTIYRLLNECTQPPRIRNSKWEREKSWLWEINHLRNHIAHQSIVSGAISVNVGAYRNIQSDMYVYRPKGNPNNSIKESKPREYFDMCFQRFEQLKDNIEKLL